ncbi:MAG: hypothetical protein FWD52_05470 [Candidatus Bathyarchaeota archaeon]|nr:hypothetical protein [Candidatus Termiticorpusculum sp.]
MRKATIIAVMVIVLSTGFFIYSAHVEYEKRYTTGYSAGYLEGVKDGAGSGYTIRNPTYDEMMAFLVADKTDQNVYDTNTYNCYDYTKDVCKNAMDQGYRVGFVYLYFKDSAHALVCFDTVDRGLVFVEPQYDTIVNVEVGIHYWNNVPNVRSSFDDTIIRFGIIW